MEVCYPIKNGTGWGGGRYCGRAATGGGWGGPGRPPAGGGAVGAGRGPGGGTARVGTDHAGPFFLVPQSSVFGMMTKRRLPP